MDCGNVISANTTKYKTYRFGGAAIMESRKCRSMAPFRVRAQPLSEAVGWAGDRAEFLPRQSHSCYPPVVLAA
jgi:hypothetical protein